MQFSDKKSESPLEVWNSLLKTIVHMGVSFLLELGCVLFKKTKRIR